ncbi:MAG: DUF4388 domain-containing protein [Nitrospiria bacterium]
MSLEGRLEDLGLADIIQIIGLSKRSGVLTIIQKEGTGRLVFNKGLLIFGTSDSVSQLGYVLIRKNVITIGELEKALKLQRTGNVRRPVGTILIKMGAITKESLQTELKSHLAEVLRDFLSWDTGSFHFELGKVMENDPILDEGLNMDFLMMEASRLQDEYNREQEEVKAAKSLSLKKETPPEKPPATLSQEKSVSTESLVSIVDGSSASLPSSADSGKVSSRDELSLLTAMIEEISGPTSRSEITLLVLRYASEIMNRAVVFLVRKEDMVGLGQFGLSFKDESADERIRRVRIPLNESSLFREITEKKNSYKGALAEEKWHQYFIEQIGGGWPKEVFLAPLLNESRVIALLYGDNLPQQSTIKDTDGLEVFVKVAGFAFGKAMLERKLQEVNDKKSS